MGRKAVGPVCCVMHVKEPSALIEKRRGSPRCSWFDWQHIAPQHLVNHYMVLCKRSRSHNSNVVPHTLQENTECSLRNKCVSGSILILLRPLHNIHTTRHELKWDLDPNPYQSRAEPNFFCLLLNSALTITILKCCISALAV